MEMEETPQAILWLSPTKEQAALAPWLNYQSPSLY
jgi:hypothetical protein